MNPLPRFLGLALFLVLAVLAALLAAPLWQPVKTSAIGTPRSSAIVAPPGPSQPTPPTAKMARFSQRVTLALALVGLALTAALVFTLAARPPRTPDTQPPIASARQEIDTLARLAESSVAQGAELSRERDGRRRAQEDAQLKQHLLAESVEEKIRLGRDLHDGIIQSLYAVGLTVETLRPLLKTNPAQVDQRLDEIRASLNAAIRDVRAYITGLAPENLRRASFRHSIVGLFDQLRAGRNAQIEIDVDDEAAGQLSVDQNIEALQIAREAISNALRHGEASVIKLRMHKSEGEVSLLVQDNGRGFDARRDRTGGHGLGNMHARAARLGATLRISSQPGEGARVVATFPILPTTTV